MHEELDKTRPQGQVKVVLDPRYWVTRLENGDCILQLHDPEHGWHGFLIPSAEAHRMSQLLAGTNGSS